jgi:hypothetical protein
MHTHTPNHHLTWNRAMPTIERRDFVIRKARDSFRAQRSVSPAMAAAAVEHGEIMCVPQCMALSLPAHCST